MGNLVLSPVRIMLWNGYIRVVLSSVEMTRMGFTRITNYIIIIP